MKVIKFNGTGKITQSLLLMLLILVFPGTLLFAQSKQHQGFVARSFGSEGYTTSVDDLRVKVLGGHLRVSRTYQAGGWVVNQRWSNIDVKLSITGNTGREDLDSIHRNGITHKFKPGVIESESMPDWAFQHPGFPNLTTALRRTFYAKHRSGRIDLYHNQSSTSNYLIIHGARWKDNKGHWIRYIPTGTLPNEKIALKILNYGDRNGLIATFQYNDATNPNRITGISDRLNKQILWYEYNLAGELSAIRDYTNRRVEYIYTNGKLTTVKDVRGFNWQYVYGASTFEMIDPEGRKTVVDGTGRVKSVLTYPAGGGDPIGTYYDYNLDDKKQEYYVQKKTTGGRITEQIFNSVTGDLIREDVNGQARFTNQLENGQRKQIFADEDGNKVVNEFDNNTNFNLVKRTHSDGSTQRFKYEPKYSQITEKINERGFKTQYEYDTNGNLVRKKDAVGTPSERVTEYTRNGYGYLTLLKRLGDASTAESIISYTYDDYGNRLTITDAEANVTTYTYDVIGNIFTERDARAKTWTYTYDDSGRLLTEKDPLNHIASNTYNKVGMLTQSKAADNTITSYAYDGFHRLIKVTDALNGETVYSYTLDGQRAKEVDEDGDGVDIVYDLSGRLVGAKDAEGNQFDVEYDNNALGVAHVPVRTKFLSTVTEYQYDKRYRQTAVIYRAQGVEPQVTKKQYDVMSNVTRVTDALNRSTTYQYDALNRLTKTIDALNGETVYTYDDRSNRLSFTDANNNTTKFQYDRNNRLLKEIRPMGEERVNVYGAAGFLEYITTENGDRIAYEYDDAGRNTVEKHYLAGSLTTPVKTINYTYNALNSLTGYSDGTTTSSYTYDDLQRKTREVINYGTFSLEHSYTYTKSGNIKSYTSPDGVTLNYAYDKAGRLKTISQAGQGAISINEYLGYLPKKLTLPGGSTQQASYDPLLRLVGLHSKDGAGNTIMQQALTYDAEDNILEKVTEHGRYEYSYDALDRLLTAKSPNSPDESYTYDAIGNRLTDTSGVQYAYNANNELLSYGGITYQYDNNGNRIRKTESGINTHYKYNVINDLAEVQDHSQASTAQYYSDPFSYRLRKTLPTETINYHYSNEGLAGEFNATGSRLRSYTYIPVQSYWQSAPASLFEPAQGHAYFHIDSSAMTNKATASNGALKWSAQYQAFGKATIDQAEVTNNLRYPGQIEDAESGLHYNHYRTYDPQIGRYLQSDPAGLSGSINSYGYAGENPVNNIDPHGDIWPVAGRICSRVSACKNNVKKAIKSLVAWMFPRGRQPAYPPGSGPGSSGSGSGGGQCPAPPPPPPMPPLPFPNTGPLPANPPVHNDAADNSPSRDKTITKPAKPKRGVTCTCRAQTNGQQEGNNPSVEFAFGTATAPTYRQARAQAERIARKKLSKQAKHTQCKCTDQKGN